MAKRTFDQGTILLYYAVDLTCVCTRIAGMFDGCPSGETSVDDGEEKGGDDDRFEEDWHKNVGEARGYGGEDEQGRIRVRHSSNVSTCTLTWLLVILWQLVKIAMWSVKLT